MTHKESPDTSADVAGGQAGKSGNLQTASQRHPDSVATTCPGIPVKAWAIEGPNGLFCAIGLTESAAWWEFCGDEESDRKRHDAEVEGYRAVQVEVRKIAAGREDRDSGGRRASVTAQNPPLAPAATDALADRFERALSESQAELDKVKQVAANWENLAAKYKAERGEARDECERLRELTYVPGVWRCVKCKLELMASVLTIPSGSIHANNKPQECPNGCGPLWRVTERDQRKEAQVLHEKEFLRAEAAEAREREAYERVEKALEDEAMLCDSDMEYDNNLENQDKQGTAFNRGVRACIRVVRALGERREG